MSKTKIAWTTETWNPVTGCTRLSEGCARCYMFPMAKRYQMNPRQPKYRNGSKVTMHPDCLSIPLENQKPTLYFVNSMSDLFHDEVSEKFVRLMFDVMTQADQHTFQVLTKRSARMRALAPSLTWPDNIWAGVTVESNKHYGRIDDLRATPAKVKFLSLEPLLSEVSGIPLEGIDWVIVGGEKCGDARPMEKDWVLDVRDKCVSMKIPFFFKQWGGSAKVNAERGILLDGREWRQMPKAMEAAA